MNRIRKPIIAGNWKMQGSRQKVDDFMTLFINGYEKNKTSFSNMDIVICPPFPYLSEVHSYIAKTTVELGAQNVYFEAEGAFTGEVSPSMLVDSSCRYVIIGHSERRKLFNETDSLIARKFQAAYDASLTPILCVGETETERKQGQTLKVVQRQCESVLEVVGIEAFKKAVLAYEPVWAIGTGITATPEQAAEVHTFLRSLFKSGTVDLSEQVRILYGGSVKASNAEQLFAQTQIDGALVGAASLNAEEFLTICRLIT